VNGSDRAIVVRRALAPVALMGLIFFLSAQSDLTTGHGFWDEVLRKLAHATEYGALTLLWAWALAPILAGGTSPAAAAIALLYAASDEYHQSSVAGRTGSPGDVAIDAVGVAVALLALRYHPRVRSAVESGQGVSERGTPLSGGG
jgi:VanZ family protein